MRVVLSLALVAVTTGSGLAAAAQPAAGPAGFQPAAGSAVSSTRLVACRALEAHTDPTLGVTVVVFHQRDDADQGRVGALLRAHDGTPIEFKTADGASHAATVMRLKSCFGRGLLVFRAADAALAEKDVFLLREPEAGAH